jgi:NAD(P)H-dependent FMN reductase
MVIDMSKKPRILAFAGSLRKDSLNKKLIKIAAAGAQQAEAEVTLIDLKDYPLPLYDQDIEDLQGLPENALKLKKLMVQHDGFLIASPEYNSSIPAVLKNVIDWTSRKAEENEPFLSCFFEKPVALLSASPGQLGGMRGLVHVRSMFCNIFCYIIPQQKSISQAHLAFSEEGNLKNTKDQEDVLNVGRKLAQFIIKFNAK